MSEQQAIKAGTSCPRCGGPTSLRTVTRRGSKHSGRKFWGCDAFPACHGTVWADAGVQGASVLKLPQEPAGPVTMVEYYVEGGKHFWHEYNVTANTYGPQHGPFRNARAAQVNARFSSKAGAK